MSKKNNRETEAAAIVWEACNKLRSNISPSDYKYVILGLIFIKQATIEFNKRYEAVKKEDPRFIDDIEEYASENIFYLPEQSRWNYILKHSKDPSIAILIDNALDEIEKVNIKLRGALFKIYTSLSIDPIRLGEVVEIIENINIKDEEEDFLGRIYEQLLTRFARAEGKGGGEFFTPSSVVKTLVEVLEPYEGKVYDPACGSGGMFIQSANFIKEHGRSLDKISIYGQELNSTTWKLARLNIALRKLEANLGATEADTFTNDQHVDLKADFVMANPPFNVDSWGQEELLEDRRWKYGVPPKGNANYAWIQHMLYHLNNKGKAGIVLANGSLSTTQKAELEIRKRLINDNKIDAIISLPDKLFLTTQIPVSIWILNNNKNKEEILFIDAKNVEGNMIDRANRELTEADISKISTTYHNWLKDKEYKEEKGYTKSIPISEIDQDSYALTPGRYVGIKEREDDGISFDEKMDKLTSELSNQFNKSHELEKEIKKQLKSIGWEI